MNSGEIEGKALLTVVARSFWKRGGAVIWVLLFLAVIPAVLGIFAYFGSQAEARLSKYLEEGMSAIEQDLAVSAVEFFQKAVEEFGFPLQVFRALAGLTGKTFKSKAEIDQAFIIAFLMLAYDDFFDLKPSDKAVSDAQAKLKTLPASAAQELVGLLNTAKEVSDLCRLFGEKKYEEVMKKLLKVEKDAQKDDKDFFIMEIRFLIACGKALKEPEILARARELLWFVSYEVGVKGPKIEKLWGLLHK